MCVERRCLMFVLCHRAFARVVDASYEMTRPWLGSDVDRKRSRRGGNVSQPGGCCIRTLYIVQDEEDDVPVREAVQSDDVLLSAAGRSRKRGFDCSRQSEEADDEPNRQSCASSVRGCVCEAEKNLFTRWPPL